MQMKKYFLVLLMLLFSATGWGQAKIYTKKARIADFQTKTTKVVLSGNPLLDATLREEVASRWRISPYEFCSVADYEALKDKTLYYFLRLATDSDFAYLILTKGGPKEDLDPLKERFDVVSLPVSSAGLASGRGLVYMSAFVDIIQNYMERAILSDKAAYVGITAERIPSGRKVLLDSDEADRAFAASTPGVLAGLIISPAAGGRGTHCYKMLIATDDHRLHYFKKERIRSGEEPDFNQRDRARLKIK